MPSSVAHGLAGLALVQLFRFPAGESALPASRRRWLLGAVLISSLATDFDFIPGFLVGVPGLFHRGPTHSLGAAALFAVLVMLFARWRPGRSPNALGLFLGIVYASHVLLDLLTVDFGDQIGVPLFWPLSDSNLALPFHVFLYIQRGPSADGFLSSQLNSHNGYAVLWEIVVMSIVLLVVRLVGPAPSRLWARVAGRMRGE